MATRVAIGKKIAEAIETIESVSHELGNEVGLAPASIPLSNRRGETELRIDQLSAIARWLKRYAEQNIELEIPQHYLDAENLAREGATKAEIVVALTGESNG